MNKETYEALIKKITALESGNTDFLGKELKLINSWIDEVSKEYEECAFCKRNDVGLTEIDDGKFSLCCDDCWK